MAKKYTRAELIEQSHSVFESNPGNTKLIATSDGNFFLEKNRQEAVQHAQKEGLEIENISIVQHLAAKAWAKKEATGINPEEMVAPLVGPLAEVVQEGSITDEPSEILPEPEQTPEPETVSEPAPKVEVTPEPETVPETDPKAPTKKKASTK